MTKSDVFFNELPFKEKLRTLFLEGDFIVSIRYYGYKVNLYLLNNFYVEVFYNHKHDFIEKVLPLDKNHSRMKFYSDQIKLPVDI
ncbi:hypothetical protein [Fulvivirga ligni]|uniref:hypothetical protein n=1 Tax=Fulvivirga ligni TaxID=2904246 RepID=UPI001F410132|nr:hypothetical protein [Fulvivirga ligni]UII21915.1 hypothetical protein LVD16_01535 [Fulvivirga ligni]